MEPATSTFKNRPCNRFEQNLLLLDQAANFSFNVIARISGALDVDILRQALDYVQRQHYYLNVSLDLGSPPAFVVHPTLPIPVRVLTNTDRTAWQEEAERELNTKFDLTRGPLARAVLLTRQNEADLIVTFEHLSADGMSGAHFVREVVAACGQLAQGVRLPQASPQSVLYPDPQWFPKSVSGVRGLPKLLSFLARYGYDALRFGKKHYPKPEWIPFERRDVRLTHYLFSREDTERLINRCRTAQTTMQGALSASLLLTLASELREKANVPEPVINCVSSVNARPYCRTDISDRHLGLWVGQVVRPYLIRPGTDFWTLARAVIGDLRRALTTDMLFVPYRLLFRRVYTDAAAFTRLFENSQPYIEATNLGRLAFETTYGPFELTRLHMGTGLQFTQASPWGLTIAATTFAGQLQTNFHYLATCWDAETADRVSQAIVDRLLQAS
ncbi:MAG TPA: condensation domain-containing protein [Anaerolineae bacterium]|nr:condensation domain-containing protein [Anaerolineae bacterium]HQK14152.1 condensation domain-containing protein [Anaerolineae bacterium]